MKTDNLFAIEIMELNRRNRSERLLDDLLAISQISFDEAKSPLDFTRQIVELYMQVIRQRNHLRRNWHPEKSMRCDMVVLDHLGKKGVRSSIMNRLDEAIANAHKWDRQKIEESMQKIKDEFDRAFSDGQANIARTVRNSPLKQEVREIFDRIDDCSFDDILHGLRAKEGGSTIVKVYDDAVEHRDSSKPKKPNKITTYSRLRNILTEVKQGR
jgi:DNA-binding transcriptional regulator YbjK